MSRRKRVNISIDPIMYSRLQGLKKQYGFKNVCELMVAFANILLDRMQSVNEQQYNIPEEDGRFIDGMFDDLKNTEHTPDGTVPVRHNKRDRYG